MSNTNEFRHATRFTTLVEVLIQIGKESCLGIVPMYNRSLTQLVVRDPNMMPLAQLDLDLENHTVELSTMSCGDLARAEALDCVLPTLIAYAKQLQAMV